MVSIEKNKIYRSGLLSETELAAGGVMFYCIYQVCVRFSDHTVKIWNDIVDEGMPYDDELELLKSEIIECDYKLNQKGYIEFETEDKVITVNTSEASKYDLIFFIWNKNSSMPDSLVVSLNGKPNKLSQQDAASGASA